MIIRPMTLKDLPRVMEIEKQSFLFPWNEDHFRYELNVNPYSVSLVAEHERAIVGFINFWVMFDRAYINQIAVAPGYRKQKIGTTLMNDFLQRMRQNETKTVHLEVRVSNAPAIAFYRAFAFKEILKKPKYYDNGEDAFLMELTL